MKRGTKRENVPCIDDLLSNILIFRFSMAVLHYQRLPATGFVHSYEMARLATSFFTPIPQHSDEIEGS